MDNRNDFDSKDNNPLEIPDNAPSKEEKPIQGVRSTAGKKIKVAYAFAVLLAIGAALTAKIATEKTLGNIAPIESDYVTVQEQNTVYSESFVTDEPEFEVRNNLTDVPDTREPETAQTTAESTAQTTEKSSKFAQPYKDYFTLPVGTKILREYSPNTPVYSATMGDWRTHSAIDFQGVDGEQVKAIAHGKVAKVYTDMLLGTVIEVDHGNEVIAKYCGINADTVQVKAGATVDAGTLLGYLGTVPCEKADISHLHFEITHKGQNVDPLELMGR